MANGDDPNIGGLGGLGGSNPFDDPIAEIGTPRPSSMGGGLGGTADDAGRLMRALRGVGDVADTLGKKLGGMALQTGIGKTKKEVIELRKEVQSLKDELSDAGAGLERVGGGLQGGGANRVGGDYSFSTTPTSPGQQGGYRSGVGAGTGGTGGFPPTYPTIPTGAQQPEPTQPRGLQGLLNASGLTPGTAALGGFGVVAGQASRYMNRNAEGIVSTNYAVSQMARSMPGGLGANQANIQNWMMGPSVGPRSFTGGADLYQGALLARTTTGAGFGDPRTRQAMGQIGGLSMLAPEFGFTGAAQAFQQMRSPQAQQMLRRFGIGPGQNLSPEEMIRTVTQQSFGGRTPTLREIQTGFQQGAPLERNLAAVFGGAETPGFRMAQEFIQAEARTGRQLDLTRQEDVEAAGLTDNLLVKQRELVGAQEELRQQINEDLIPAQMKLTEVSSGMYGTFSKLLKNSEGLNTAFGAGIAGLSEFGSVIEKIASWAIGLKLLRGGAGVLGGPGGGGGTTVLGGMGGRGGRLLRGAGRFAGIAGAGYLAGELAEGAIEAVGPQDPSGTATRNTQIMGGVASGALTGAALGTIVPGVGNVVGGLIGAGVGALAGGAMAQNRAGQGDPPSLTGMKPDMANSLKEMLEDNPALQVRSGKRDSAEQEKLHKRWKAGKGPYAAPPGEGKHESGDAVDLGPPSQWGWLKANAERYGLEQTVDSEPWHYERKGSRSPSELMKVRDVDRRSPAGEAGEKGYAVGRGAPTPERLKDQSTIAAMDAYGKQVPGARRTSAYRSGSTTYHGKAQATDWGGPKPTKLGYKDPGLRKIYEHWWKVRHKLRELFLTGAPRWISSGRERPPSKGRIWKTHKDHVHVATTEKNLGGGGESILDPSDDRTEAPSNTGKAAGTTPGIAGASRYGSIEESELLAGILSGEVTGAGSTTALGSTGKAAGYGRDSSESAEGGTAPSGNYSGNKAVVQQVAAKHGWGSGAQWKALENLVERESSWKNTAQNPKSTAYGLFQFLNSTWSGTGIKKTSDPRQQAEAGMRYIKSRYGSPAGAWSFWQKNKWYDPLSTDVASSAFSGSVTEGIGDPPPSGGGRPTIQGWTVSVPGYAEMGEAPPIEEAPIEAEPEPYSISSTGPSGQTTIARRGTAGSSFKQYNISRVNFTIKTETVSEEEALRLVNLMKSKIQETADLEEIGSR